MSFPTEYIKYGVVNVSGRTVRIHKSPSSFITITNIQEDITDARWVGDTIVVYLKSGTVRKYSTLSYYVQILK